MKAAMNNINSDDEGNQQLVRLYRRTALIYRPLAANGVNDLFAEIAKYTRMSYWTLREKSAGETGRSYLKSLISTMSWY